MLDMQDVVIVGSGPAGCATAVKLHDIAPELASRVVVIDALRHPREKICAGGINGQAWKLLDELGIKADVENVKIDRAVVKTVVGDVVLNSPDVSRIVRRDKFDEAIAANLKDRDIELFEGVRVQKASREGSFIKLKTTAGDIRARAVVGADGACSVVRKTMFHQPDITFLLALAECPAEGHFTHQENTLIMDCVRADKGVPGYRWIFPFLENGKQWVNVGICEYVHRTSHELKAELVDHMKDQDLNSEKARFRFFPERLFHPNNPFCAPGVLLAGEAAGIDPFLGEGVSYCLRYGILTAETLADAMRSEDYSFSNHLHALKWSNLYKALMGCWTFNRMFYSKFHRAMIKTLAMNEKVAHLLGEVLAGRIEPSMELARKLILAVAKNIIKL